MLLRKKLMSVDSYFRSSGESHDYQIQYLDRKELTGVHKIQLNSVNIPNSFYNLTKTSTLDYNIDGVDYVFTLDPGQYTTTKIIAMFAVFVLTHAGPEKLELDPITGFFSLVFPGLSGIVYNQGVNDDTDLSIVLGLQPISTTDKIDGEATPTLGGTRDVFIHFDFIGGNMISPNGSNLKSSVFCSVQMNSIPFGGILNYKGDDKDFIEFQTATNITSFRCWITDIDGKTLDLNGSDWTVLLSIWYNST